MKAARHKRMPKAWLELDTGAKSVPTTTRRCRECHAKLRSTNQDDVCSPCQERARVVPPKRPGQTPKDLENAKEMVFAAIEEFERMSQQSEIDIDVAAPPRTF